MEVTQRARQVTACRACGGSDWQEVIDFGSVPLAGAFVPSSASYEDEHSYPLGVISCRSCRLMSLTHVVDPEILYRVYAYTTSESETMSQHMANVVVTCREKFALPPGSLVVEIGSNSGTQLLAFRDAGMRTLGIDPALNIASVANEQGVETLAEFFSAPVARSVRSKFGAADLILGRHVFAHIDDLADIVAGIRDLLAPDGVFAIEVPYALDLLEKNEFDTIYHEHLSYFSVRSFSRLFSRHGMRVVDVERFGVHGGSILVFVSLSEARWQTSPVVADLLSLEQSAGLDDDATYQRFAETVKQVTSDLTGLVRDLAAEGKRIAGYGAPAKGNTLLCVSGLGLSEIEYCSDSTLFKQGMTTPGTHIPVHSPEYAQENPPDYFLLLAWNYADEILRKEWKFLEAGGKFIIPIPKPSIVSAV